MATIKLFHVNRDNSSKCVAFKKISLEEILNPGFDIEAELEVVWEQSNHIDSDWTENNSGYWDSTVRENRSSMVGDFVILTAGTESVKYEVAFAGWEKK